MKVVVQRVKSSEVRINGEIVGKIGKGLLVFIGFKDTDDLNIIEWMSNKLANLRIFSDESGKMNKSVIEINGEILLISNFTLYGDVLKGFRPSFSKAGEPVKSQEKYNRMIEFLKSKYNLNIESGIFGAMMDVSLINDGPVTIIIEKDN